MRSKRMFRFSVESAAPQERLETMGEVLYRRPVLRMMAISSCHESAFAWAKEQATASWGPICLESPRFDFSETKFYTRTMGAGLLKQLVAFESLIDQHDVVTSKLESNQWEAQFKAKHDFEQPRPINLDPGYVTEAKLVLATTKDRDHRIFIKDGIFAEVTLFYQFHKWHGSRWTYPDYLREDVTTFMSQCRDLLREKYSSDGPENGTG